MSSVEKLKRNEAAEQAEIVAADPYVRFVMPRHLFWTHKAIDHPVGDADAWYDQMFYDIQEKHDNFSDAVIHSGLHRAAKQARQERRENHGQA